MLRRIRIKGPKQGDLVLWEDDIWEIDEIKGKEVFISLVGGEGDEDHLLIRSLVSSDIKVWGTEGEPIEDQEEY